MAGVWILALEVLLSGFPVYGKIENVALNKNTTASSYYSTWPASQVVDGDSDIYGESRTCYYTFLSPSFWTVDLGREYQLYDIKVYLRAGCESFNLYRTTNSIIYLDNNPSRVCFTFPSTISNNPTSVTCNETARYVTIRNPGNGPGEDDALNICEVVINGCSNGTYGMDCLNNCNCPYCNRWSGICSGNCYSGWIGERCDTECKSNTYGINCDNRCADRKCCNDSSSCDHITGSCASKGCRPGWKSADCTEKCGAQSYGNNCSRFCNDRHCYGISTCNHVTGSCDRRCQSGWKGVDCLQICDSKQYGPDCTGVCTNRNCKGDLSCSSTGQCPEGCATGWKGIDCTECGDMFYGINCSRSCADRHRDGVSACNHVTGSCDKGCQAGWKGLDCSEACDREHYGPDCTGVCASRHCEGGSSCNSTTGMCDQGCLSGWKEEDCSVRAGGDSTPIIVGTVVGVVLLVVIIILVIVLIRKRNNTNTSANKFNNIPSQSVKVEDQGSEVMKIS